MYKYGFDKSSKKFNCPACSQKKFVRLMNYETREYLPDGFGKCDRLLNCGYERGLKAYFAEYPTNDRKKTARRNRTAQDAPRPVPSVTAKQPDYIPREFLLQTLTNYERNNFVKFLLALFPREVIEKVIADYAVGTFEDYCCFPKITRSGRIAQAKLMKFDAETGGRLKTDNFAVSSLPAELKKRGKMKGEFNSNKTVFFGEHLARETSKPLGIVESEKTAVISAICLPSKIWLASGSVAFLKSEKLKKFKGREVVLYPDGKAFADWSAKAKAARFDGVNVKVSELIERNATDEQKARDADLADYLINERITELEKEDKRRAEFNAQIGAILESEFLFEKYNEILDERKAISIIDGGLNEQDAEKALFDFDFVRPVVSSFGK